jgi:glycerol-3-phosphate dehydrogenase
VDDPRATHLERLRSGRFDLLVVGGGIIGAGLAELAARHGFAVALVERDDFASGTSSASSKLVHGGLRYLRMGHFGLVREALDKMRALSEVVAPHLVRPLPVYRGARERQWASTAEDVLRRRTTLSLTGRDSPAVRKRVEELLRS